MNKRTIKANIWYSTLTLTKEFRYELCMTARKADSLRCFKLVVYIFAAKPTKRQISAVKRHFCKGLGE